MVWKCINCTYDNENGKRKCKLCGAEKPEESLEDLFALQSIIEWQCIKCGTYNNGNKIKCGECGSVGSWCEESAEDEGKVLKPDVSSAECPECTDKVDEETGREETATSLASQDLLGISAGGTDLKERTCTSHGIPENEMRLVLLGHTGEGKSATGNTLLGSEVFESTLSSISVTKCCERGTASRFGRDLQVIDTPGMFDTEMSVSDITTEVIKCVGMTAPGPHAFLLVLRPDRFTEEIQNTIDHYVKIFGEEMLRYLVVVFTRKDDLIYSRKSIEDYLAEDSGELQNLLVCCNSRYIAVNNRGTDVEKDEDVRSLIGMIDEMVLENRGVYSNEMFQQAEVVMKDKEMKIRREYELELERFRNQIEEACNKQIASIEENYVDITRQLQRRLQELEEHKADRSRQDAMEIRKELKELKAQHLEEMRKMREQAKADREALTKHTMNFREKARKEVNGNPDFFKETLLPALVDLSKLLIPGLIQLGIALVRRK